MSKKKALDSQYDIKHHKDYPKVIKHYDDTIEKLQTEITKLKKDIEKTSLDLKYFDITQSEDYKFILNKYLSCELKNKNKNKKIDIKKIVPNAVIKKKAPEFPKILNNSSSSNSSSSNYDNHEQIYKDYNLTDWAGHVGTMGQIKLLDSDSIYPYSYQ
jgi:hypothetical protein